MIFLSAGHHLKDAGAVANGFKEADLTIELRGLIAKELDAKGYKYILDDDRETLTQYINRIKPGSGSVICDLHFNASSNKTATGVEVLYPDTHKPINKSLATEMSSELSIVIGIRNRGGKPESTSARGRLAILRTKAGISFLPELCFITNEADMCKYNLNKESAAKVIAKYLILAEDYYN